MCFYCRYITELFGGEKYVSCSVVLPALCHLLCIMEASHEDPAYIVCFKSTFTKNSNKQKENSNLSWLKVAASLGPRFKDLRCLPKAERGEVWQRLSEMIKDREPAPLSSVEERATKEDGPPTDGIRHRF